MSFVSVSHLQTNGTFTTGTYVKLEDLDLITPDSFTLCIWLFVSFLRGTNSFFVSYATEGDNNIVTGCQLLRNNTGNSFHIISNHFSLPHNRARVVSPLRSALAGHGHALQEDEVAGAVRQRGTQQYYTSPSA